MAIFIKNIPKDTHFTDIYHFVAPALHRHFPFKSGHVAKTEIFAILDKFTHEIEYHGLVLIEPEEADLRVIPKLNGKRFQNKLVVVKEYVNRDWHNDRRTNYAELPEDNINNRISDRRRGHQVELIKDTSMIWQEI